MFIEFVNPLIQNIANNIDINGIVKKLSKKIIPIDDKDIFDKYIKMKAETIEDKNLKMKLKDSVSPVLIEDSSDKNSYYVIMPMKI